MDADGLTFACAMTVEERIARRLGRTAVVGLGASKGVPEGRLVSFGIAGALSGSSEKPFNGIVHTSDPFTIKHFANTDGAVFLETTSIFVYAIVSPRSDSPTTRSAPSPSRTPCGR